MTIKSSRNPEKDLAELRDRLGLYEQIPILEDVHVVAFSPTDGQVVLCCHDKANDDAHLLIFEPGDKSDGPRMFNDENAISDEMQITCEHVVCAAYN